VTGVALLVAIPLGTAIAIYLSEFAGHRLRETVKPILELLGAVPTVVFGYFALLLVTPLLQKIIPGLPGFNMLSAGLVIGIIGAFIAGWLLPRIGIHLGGGIISSIINATIGAVILLVVFVLRPLAQSLSASGSPLPGAPAPIAQNFAEIEKTGARMTLPCLLVEYQGDNGIFPSDQDLIARSLGTRALARARIPGDHYGFPAETGRERATAALVEWLKG